MRNIQCWISCRSSHRTTCCRHHSRQPANRIRLPFPRTRVRTSLCRSALTCNQKPKRRRHLSGSKSADAPRKKRTPPGRINAPRQLNGRFLKLSEGRTGKSLELVRRDLDIENSTEENSDSSHSAFTMPLPSELVNEIFNFCILPHLNTECMSEMETLVRKNLFIKHYRPQLILFLSSAHSGTTYKSLDALVVAALRKLGF